MAQAVTIKGKTAKAGFFLLSLARISLGLTFLWAFFDKTFGLGFATCRNAVTDVVSTGCSQAWIHGGSPTTGFLKKGVQGPFADWFHSLAGHTWVDWLFMIGLLGIGLSLLFGVMVRLGAIAGSVMLFLMWLALLWPANNPVIDEHMVYIFILLTIAVFARYQSWCCGKWWQSMRAVRKMPWMV